MLGLKISTSGYGVHITEAVNKAKVQLSKLFNLRKLQPNQIRTIYNMTVRPTLTYPAIPLVCATKNEKIKLQRIQNKAAKIITGHKYYEEGPITAENLNKSANLLPINIILYKQATNIWNKIELHDPEILEDVKNIHTINRIKPKRGFTPSIPILEKNIKPIYTIKDDEYDTENESRN